MIRVDAAVFDRAGRLQPTSLRPLDALHLAAALTLDNDLGGIVAYDERLRDTAESIGVEVMSPGAVTP